MNIKRPFIAFDDTVFCRCCCCCCCSCSVLFLALVLFIAFSMKQSVNCLQLPSTLKHLRRTWTCWKHYRIHRFVFHTLFRSCRFLFFWAPTANAQIQQWCFQKHPTSQLWGIVYVADFLVFRQINFSIFVMLYFYSFFSHSLSVGIDCGWTREWMMLFYPFRIQYLNGQFNWNSNIWIIHIGIWCINSKTTHGNWLIFLENLVVTRHEKHQHHHQQQLKKTLVMFRTCEFSII